MSVASAGFRFCLPTSTKASLAFTVTPAGVRFGLTAIKNVGEGAIESLLDVRKKQGRISSLHALCEDLDLRLANKRVFESLVKAGAFDSMAIGHTELSGLPSSALRPRLLAAIDAACEHGARHQRDALEGQAQLFGACDDSDGQDESSSSFVTCRCKMPRRGPRPSSWRSRKKHSACIGAVIPSIGTRRN